MGRSNAVMQISYAVKSDNKVAPRVTQASIVVRRPGYTPFATRH